jgi:hypothetical protein
MQYISPFADELPCPNPSATLTLSSVVYGPAFTHCVTQTFLLPHSFCYLFSFLLSIFLLLSNKNAWDLVILSGTNPYE